MAAEEVDLVAEARRLQQLAAEARGDDVSQDTGVIPQRRHPRFQAESDQAAANYEIAAALLLLANTNKG
jgi:hypothetical protein